MSHPKRQANRKQQHNDKLDQTKMHPNRRTARTKNHQRQRHEHETRAATKTPETHRQTDRQTDRQRESEAFQLYAHQ